jgi:hypothetical protein
VTLRLTAQLFPGLRPDRQQALKPTKEASTIGGLACSIPFNSKGAAGEIPELLSSKGNPDASSSLVHVLEKPHLSGADSLLKVEEMKTIATFGRICSRSFHAVRALGVGVGRSPVPHFQRPLIPLQRWIPCEVRPTHNRIISCAARLGKQRDNQAKRLDFGTQARQIHLFRSQHFKYIFHRRQAPASNELKPQNRFAQKWKACCFPAGLGRF